MAANDKKGQIHWSALTNHNYYTHGIISNLYDNSILIKKICEIPVNEEQDILLYNFSGDA